MSVENWIQLISGIGGIASYIWLVPMAKRRLFLFAYLLMQGMLWLVDIVCLQLKLIEYPVRLFPQASAMGLTTEYWIFPILGAFCVTYEPKSSWKTRLFFLTIWTFGLSLLDLGLEHYTRIIDYKSLNFYHIMLKYAVCLVAINAVTIWFFEEGKSSG